MKKFCTLVIMLCFLSCAAEITRINDMEEVFEYIHGSNSNTLIIFDVDMVLVQPSDPAFQMANMKRFSKEAKCIMKELPKEKEMIFLSLMTINSDPVLIDIRTPHFIQEAIQKNISIIALTANLTGKLGPIENMEQWRVDSLRKLGIDFTKVAPYPKKLIFNNLASYRGNYSTYTDGILFVNGTVVSKGEAFLTFLQKIDFYPNKIIFIDDREENLRSLESALQTINKSIEYHGIHFLGAQEYPSESISEETFKHRWKELSCMAKELD